MVVSGALAALALLLSSVLAFVTLVALRPIGQLTAQAQRLGAGELGTRIELHTPDEMGMLAAEFNAMADAVEERERRLRGVLNTMAAGLVLSEHGQIDMANPAAKSLWSIGPGDPLPAWLGKVGTGHHESHPEGGRLYTLDVAPFGEQGTLVLGEDVTDRVAVRDRLARSERLALVGQMLAQITHEVRNPLNAMSLNAELLSEDLPEGEAQAMLQTITGEIRRLEQLTSRYLDLSRRRQPILVPTHPLQLARQVLQVEEEALRRADVSAEVSGCEGEVVELDADALNRALRNLILNAVEAGAQHIQIAVEQLQSEVRLSIRDDGPGLTPEQIEQVFEPFYTTKAKGTGLGLAISRQELEETGGQLLCAGAEDGGAVFTLILPTA
jgi:signal transduction histidine kinase